MNVRLNHLFSFNKMTLLLPKIDVRYIMNIRTWVAKNSVASVACWLVNLMLFHFPSCGIYKRITMLLYFEITDKEETTEHTEETSHKQGYNKYSNNYRNYPCFFLNSLWSDFLNHQANGLYQAINDCLSYAFC